jgi:crossover junction endodeoxyribonuclease RuvC
MSSGTIRILGLDPGLTRTGWGVISIAGSKLLHIANGTIPTKASQPLSERLLIIHRALHAIVALHAPHAVAVETTFVAKDPAAALKLGHARAIPLLVAAEMGLEVAEYAPNHIKKSVVGVGHAGKEQVEAMVRCLLPTARIQASDAADALACAIAHAHLSGTNARIKAALSA